LVVWVFVVCWWLLGFGLGLTFAKQVLYNLSHSTSPNDLSSHKLQLMILKFAYYEKSFNVQISSPFPE
jgi:hypothetical protein